MQNEVVKQSEENITNDNFDDIDGAKHNPQCCCHCPSTVAMATDISYYLNLWDPQHVTVGVDVFYTNPGPQGSLRLALRTVNGTLDSVALVAAQHTNAGETVMVHVDFEVTDADFPLKLRVTGRPANLNCDIRTHKTFDIINNVSRN